MKDMQETPRAKNNKMASKRTIEAMLFSFAITMLLVSAILFGNIGQQQTTVGNAYAQTTMAEGNNNSNATITGNSPQNNNNTTSSTAAANNTSTTNMTATSETGAKTTIGKLIFRENGQVIVSRVLEAIIRSE